jgi:hypothetical protein
MWVVAAETTGALAVVVYPRSAPALAAVLGAHLLFGLRHELSTDGSDDMTTLILGAALVAAVLPGGAAATAALVFVAAQAGLSYLTSGISKAQSRPWWSGDAIVGILGTRIFGWPAAAAWLHGKPVLARISGRAVVVWETIFVVGYVAPRPWFVAILAAWASFHLACAVSMGLNTFVYAFLGCYPACLYTGDLLRRHLDPGSRWAVLVVVGAVLLAVLGLLYRVNGRSGAAPRSIPRSAPTPSH